MRKNRDLESYEIVPTDRKHDNVSIVCAAHAAKCNAEHMEKRKWCSCFGPSCLMISIIVALVIIVICLPLSVNETPKYEPEDLECKIQLVESIPIGLNYSPNSPKFMSTYEAWSRLLDIATSSIDIGSYYWTLRGDDIFNHSTANQGEDIFKRLLSNGIGQRLNIRIAQSISTPSNANEDTIELAKRNAAQVRQLDFPRLVGGGILHTKLWIADNKHFYLGSANQDWRSLTQVKELGVLAENCVGLAQDVGKIFKVYWYLGLNTSTVPHQWPKDYATTWNAGSPADVTYNENYKMSTYFSSSPPPLSAKGREQDLDAILKTISAAESFVHISVMDYYPLMLYTEKVTYWPYIDDALRRAAIDRKIAVKLLISYWPHSRDSEDYFLRSLSALSESLPGVDIQIRRFVVPADEDQEKIPFARVNHNKYMVTDNTAYISTSNWIGDYYTNTGGIAMVLRDTKESAKTQTVRADLADVFQRDWNSPYALDLRNEKIV